MTPEVKLQFLAAQINKKEDNQGQESKNTLKVL
jgi:hypothetical protein